VRKDGSRFWAHVVIDPIVTARRESYCASRTIDALWRAIGDICALYSEQECRNYLKDPGYAPN
jgi:hypothetical protein